MITHDNMNHYASTKKRGVLPKRGSGKHWHQPKKVKC